MNGLVLIDKPAGCTSHDVVNRWRKLAGTSRAGHLGTLDPMATGLLLLVSGTATRLAPYFRGDTKTYRAEITLGVESDTYDAEGVVSSRTGAEFPSLEALNAALERFRGTFAQTPPPVSAKKVNGVPAYKLARKNKPVELKPVDVTVHCLELHAFEPPKLQIAVCCSAGTYIRSIAHDLGQALGCGALLSALRRTHVNDISVENARTIPDLTELAKDKRLEEAVIPTGQMLPHLPATFVDEAVEKQIRNGREFRTSPFVVPPASPTVRVLGNDGNLIALGELVYPNVYHPKVVL